ncbi:cyclodeaminase/cyclohydrolase family protein [Desulfopila inferna]|uniref:cyclodeaminase/cyclohydrolase family protein n=1 Tax=Desulfopila inferna TaxID=468528 RepID=UPI0019646E79|nr:cyclodeaminase/cyclohydrolase family protein [Desulfopila inferna]MBM9603114.1 cyclodeaminase/cyclohydrolase family protein [Desulfopila inferna]
MLITTQVNQLLEELASDSPAPGGGSVAALSGALAAGLLAMVCRLSIGKKGLEQHAEKMQSVLNEAEALRRELEKLIDLDTEAFNSVMSAFRMAKTTAEEKSARSAAIQSSFRQAVDIPLKTALGCGKLLDLALEIAETANSNCISDLGVACHSAYAGVRGGVMNVSINLPSIKDQSFVDSTKETNVDILATAEKTLLRLDHIVSQRLL